MAGKADCCEEIMVFLDIFKDFLNQKGCRNISLLFLNSIVYRLRAHFSLKGISLTSFWDYTFIVSLEGMENAGYILIRDGFTRERR